MTTLRLLCLLAAMGLAYAHIPNVPSVRVHVRVHSTRAASPSPAPAPSHVCPLGEGFDEPRVVLPCPYDCASSGQGGACVVYPSPSQAFCTRDCVCGDASAVECLPLPSTDNEWILCAATNGSVDETCTIDASVVRGLTLVDGVALPPQLQRITVRGNRGSPFQVPTSLFERFGRQATVISLENVVLDKDTTGATLGTLRELRIVHANVEQCPLEAVQVPSLSILDLTRNRIQKFNGTEFRNLHELYLGDNAIQDLPVGSLPSRLQVLNLSRNALTQFPSDFGTLLDLRNLTMDHNAIRSIPKNAFPKASAITQLSLRNTSLTAVPSSVFQLKELSTLNLDDNDLSKASNFSRLAKSLTELSLNGARLRRLPTGLTNHRNISILSLGSNNFSTSQAIHCSPLPRSLTSLNFSSNHLRLLPSGLNELSSLTSLDLSGNEFERRVNASLLPPSLTSLHLENCQLKELPTNLKRLTRLQILSFTNNPLVGEFPVGGLPVVTTLRLDGTKITSLAAFPSSSKSLEKLSCLNCTALVSLSPLPSSLRTLTLSQTAMTTMPKGMLPTTLRSLSITDTTSLSTILEDLSIMTEMSQLTVARCSLAEFLSNVGLPSLQKLDLSNNRLQSFTITNATKLTRLSLAHNALSQFPRAIFDLSALQTLDLTGNPIRGFQPNETELAFLLKIPFLTMEQEQFASDCKSPTRVKQFSVCVQGDNGGNSLEPLGDDATNFRMNQKETASSTSWAMITLDVLLVLGLVIAGVLILRRDKREHREHMSTEKQAIYDTLAAQRSPRLTLLDVNALAACRLEMDAVVKSRRIATGSVSEVWLGIHAAKRVAVKQLLPDAATPEAVQRFTQEGKLLSELSHRNIVAFVGAAWTDTTDLALVSHYAANGDLGNYLQTATRPDDGHWDATKLQIALGMAEALVYLHSLHQPVRHQNLQSRNVLLDDKYESKLAGFDVAVRVRSVASKAVDSATLVQRIESVRWLAPELLNGSKYDASVDIFSLGVVLSELDTHTLPYAAVQDETGQAMGEDEIKSRVADGTLRLALSATCPRLIKELALRCSSFEPQDRPRAEEVAHAFREIQSTLVREQDATGVQCELKRSI